MYLRQLHANIKPTDKREERMKVLFSSHERSKTTVLNIPTITSKPISGDFNQLEDSANEKQLMNVYNNVDQLYTEDFSPQSPRSYFEEVHMAKRLCEVDQPKHSNSRQSSPR